MSDEQTKSIDERIEEEAQRIDNLWPELKGALKPPYKYGDIVKVRITGIVDYGAFCTTVDQYEYKGLIHIGKIAHGFIENIEDFISVGEEYEAKVLQTKYNNEKRCYNIEFSLLHLNLKPRADSPFVQLSSLKEHMTEKKEQKHRLVVQVERQEDFTESTPYSNYPKDVRNIMIELSNTCGILSSESEKRILDLIDQHGVFLFTKSMMKALDSFKPDLSYYLVNEIEKQFSGDGL